MMDDHEIICVARNALADALKVLLNPAIMGRKDFTEARSAARVAVGALDALLAMHPE